MYRRIGVMIGSPGDADEERQAITEAILRWNAANSKERSILLDPVKWETHATPGIQGRPQGMINEELIPQSDCLIAVFRTRAGSPTGRETSGTIEEIKEFMRQGKYVAIYFFQGAAAVGDIDPAQLQAVNDFRQEIQQDGLTDNYESSTELSAKLANHLTSIVRKITNSSPNPALQPAEDLSSNPLSPMAHIESPSKAPIEKETRVISDSGAWAFLDTHFYKTESVRQTADGDWVLEILSKDAEEDAHLSGLKPHDFGRSRPIPFAHRNDGFLVTAKSVEAISRDGKQIWTIALTPEEVEYGGSIMDFTLKAGDKTYTPDDIARLRAGRILLNNPPPIDDQSIDSNKMHEIMLESQIRGSNNPVSVENCIVQHIYRSVNVPPMQFLQLARLTAIYFLKAGGAVEHILELHLGPIINENVHVRFRGRRSRVYSNVEPAVIEIEGECPLS